MPPPFEMAAYVVPMRSRVCGTIIGRVIGLWLSWCVDKNHSVGYTESKRFNLHELRSGGNSVETQRHA